MCNECRMTPCHRMCPNYKPTYVYVCQACGEGIEVDEPYYELDGNYYHEECFEDSAVQILLKDCGATRGIADESAVW